MVLSNVLNQVQMFYLNNFLTHVKLDCCFKTLSNPTVSHACIELI